MNNLNKTKYSLDKNKDEVNKLIEYNEKLFKKYSKRKDKLDKIILNNAISNIIFLCSEMTSCLINDEQHNVNLYVEKIQKYSNYLIEWNYKNLFENNDKENRKFFVLRFIYKEREETWWLFSIIILFIIIII